MKKLMNIDLLKLPEKSVVTLYGWAATIRKMGSLSFVDLRDRSAIVQLVFNTKIDFTKESVLEVTGILQKRKAINPDLVTGHYEVEVQSYKILNLAQDIPFEINKDEILAKEDTRLQYRYLDLRRPQMYQNLLLRHKLIKAARDWLDAHGFLEIETPILSKSTPEGARDYLVLTRQPGAFFALPQSPQLYKQLLMIAGIERYFQISRAFRDEDMRKDRQPEFSQLDIEMAFIEEADLFNLMEQLYVALLKVFKIEVQTPFLQMDYDQAIELYGTDKPDLRYDYQLQEWTSLFNQCDVNLFKNQPSIKGLIFDRLLTNQELKILEEIALKNKAEKLLTIKIKAKTFSQQGLPSLIKNQLEQIITNQQIEDATLLIVAGKYEQTTQALGALRVKLNELFQLAKPDDYKFAWIVNWPMFELDEENNLQAAHHPFTAPTAATAGFLVDQPLKVKARAYDLVLNGFELASGSIRIHDQTLQRQMFAALNLSAAEVEDKFGFFLKAFQYGAPPHGGIAFGLDRLTMILCGANSIREVIAFPKNASGIDVLFNGPQNISDEQLSVYQLKKIKPGS